jgi:hypothetical protein
LNVASFNRLARPLNSMIQTILPTFAFAATLVTAQLAHSQSNNGIGERLAKQSISLIGLAEASNYGANDARCAGTAFGKYQTRQLIDTDIVPAISALGQSEGKASSPELNALIERLRSLSNESTFKAQVVPTVFERKYSEAVNGYGQKSACAAVATSFNVAIYQLQVWLKDTTASLNSVRPR